MLLVMMLLCYPFSIFAYPHPELRCLNLFPFFTVVTHVLLVAPRVLLLFGYTVCTRNLIPG